MFPSFNLSLGLLFVMPAGYYLWARFFSSASSFFALSSLSGNQAPNIDFAVDLSWHAPTSSNINSLRSAINGTGTYGFIYNSSTLPDGTPYGIVNFSVVMY